MLLYISYATGMQKRGDGNAATSAEDLMGRGLEARDTHIVSMYL